MPYATTLPSGLITGVCTTDEPASLERLQRFWEWGGDQLHQAHVRSQLVPTGTTPARRREANLVGANHIIDSTAHRRQPGELAEGADLLPVPGAEHRDPSVDPDDNSRRHRHGRGGRRRRGCIGDPGGADVFADQLGRRRVTLAPAVEVVTDHREDVPARPIRHDLRRDPRKGEEPTIAGGGDTSQRYAAWRIAQLEVLPVDPRTPTQPGPENTTPTAGPGAG